MQKIINTTRRNPDTGKYYRGERLAVNDPRAWANTLAFYGRTPTQTEVNDHLEYCIREGYATKNSEIYNMGDACVPVLYDFGIRWDPSKDLQTAQNV